MKTITQLGPEWVAAIALTLQAFIFLLQAGFLWWQARILKRHATTLEKHTEIAGTQAETAKIIGQAISQQGKVLDEQTKIMAKQFDLQRRVESKGERDRLFTNVLEMQTAFKSLDQRVSCIQLSSISDEDRSEVSRQFEEVDEKAVACLKELLTAVHISKEERKFFRDYSLKLSGLKYEGDMSKALGDVKSVATSMPSTTFHAKLGELARTPTNVEPDHL